jgi:hypothetical protein
VERTLFYDYNVKDSAMTEAGKRSAMEELEEK